MKTEKERIQRTVEFLAKCGILQMTAEHQVAIAMKDQARRAWIQYGEYKKAGFSPATAISLILAELSAPNIEVVISPMGEGDFGDGQG